MAHAVVQRASDPTLCSGLIGTVRDRVAAFAAGIDHLLQSERSIRLEKVETRADRHASDDHCFRE
jgi:hypothetical protein